MRFEELKKTHHELMLEYISILEHVSNLPFFVDNSQEFISAIEELLFSIEKITRRKKGHKNIHIQDFEFHKALILPVAFFFKLLTLRFLVRYFVESHIKEKTNLLRDSYIHLELTFDPDEPSSEKCRNWLKQAEESSLKFASTLSSWKSVRGFASALWPLGVSVLVARLSMNDVACITESAVGSIGLISFIALILILSVPILYFCLFTFFAFRYKRRLFLKRLNGKYQMGRPKKEEESGNNVYQVENMLFLLVGKRKTREFPVDIFTYAVVSFPLFLLLMIIEWQEGHTALSFSLGALLLFFESIQAFLAVKRRWK
ncbi:MAG: hypothetical protein WBA22_04095 [Candidatus Methanofastidiosia archaeon]